MMRAPRPAPLLLLAALAGCECSSRFELTVTAEAWPAADALFHRDPRWLGADGAFSVPLDDGRTLWLFGDTFVARTPANLRSQSTMVRNTVAVQRGRDPVSSAISFHWRGNPEAPTSFFPEEGDRWYWPQHGIRVGRGLFVFLSRIRATPGRGLGFEGDGWRVAVVDDASGSPADWSVRVVAPAQAPAGLVAGAAVTRVGDQIVSLAFREQGKHTGYLCRWAVAPLAAGDLDAAEWWAGSRGWLKAGALGGEPQQVLEDAGPESSLHLDPRLNRWIHVRSEGFGATTVVVSSAPSLEGPWSSPQVVFRPPESDRPDAFVYAAKGHPELEGADLVVTYATNTSADLKKLVEDTSIYYPRFVRLRLATR